MFKTFNRSKYSRTKPRIYIRILLLFLLWDFSFIQIFWFFDFLFKKSEWKLEWNKKVNDLWKKEIIRKFIWWKKLCFVLNVKWKIIIDQWYESKLMGQWWGPVGLFWKVSFPIKTRTGIYQRYSSKIQTTRRLHQP